MNVHAVMRVKKQEKVVQFPVLYQHLVSMFGSDIGENINEYEIVSTDFPLKIYKPNIVRVNDVARKFEALPAPLKKYLSLRKIQSETGWTADEFFDAVDKNSQEVISLLEKEV